MSAILKARFYYILPNSEQSIVISGLGEGFITFSLRVSKTTWGRMPTPPEGRASLRQDEFYRDVNGTMARKVYVRNLAPFNPWCAADVLMFEQPVV